MYHLNNLPSLTQKKRVNITCKHFNFVKETINLSVSSLEANHQSIKALNGQHIPAKTDKRHHLGINKFWTLILCQHNLVLIILDSVTIWLCLLLPFSYDQSWAPQFQSNVAQGHVEGCFLRLK